MGGLLKELARAETTKGGDTGANLHGQRVAASDDATPPQPSPYAQALSDTGMSRQKAHRYQRLAEVLRAWGNDRGTK